MKEKYLRSSSYHIKKRLSDSLWRFTWGSFFNYFLLPFPPYLLEFFLVIFNALPLSLPHFPFSPHFLNKRNSIHVYIFLFYLYTCSLFRIVNRHFPWTWYEWSSSFSHHIQVIENQSTNILQKDQSYRLAWSRQSITTQRGPIHAWFKRSPFGQSFPWKIPYGCRKEFEKISITLFKSY